MTQKKSQLSLLNVMLLMAIAALVAAIVALQRGNTQARLRTNVAEAQVAALIVEVMALREEHGVLAYGDRDKIHAIEIFEPRTRIWSYRVYVPPGATYCVACQINDLPSGDGPPVFASDHLPGPNEIKTLGSGAYSGGITPGEYVVTFTVYETEGGADGSDGKAHCSLDVRGKTRQQRSFSTGGQLPQDPDQPTWPKRHHARGISCIGRKTKVADSDSPLVLMTLRAFGDDGVSNSRDSDEGAILWVQKVKRY